MKVIRENVRPNGTRRVTVELQPDERMLCLQDGAFYKLGYPVDDVMAAHILADIAPVVWDSLEQRWI